MKMIQVLGTSSNSGKTTVALALCRILSDLGYRVAPFKSVNMSLNSVSTDSGKEISRSVWLQSIAAKVNPVKEMNPFLLKPERDGRSQLIVLGDSIGVMSHKDYGEYMAKHGAEIVRNSLETLSGRYDVIVSEGAGSAAEINFRGRDLANSFVSSIYNSPSLIVGDIDHGGVFAALYGTYSLMEHPETVKWLVINRMRGNRKILRPAIDVLEQKTGLSVIGVIPHLDGIKLPGEDSLDYRFPASLNRRIAVIRYPHMENHSDVDPLIVYGTGFHYVDGGSMNGVSDAELIILPGSKDVYADIRYLRSTGLDQKIIEAARSGKKILGICGGYQILGRSIHFNGFAPEEEIKGLGLLNCRTDYSDTKTVRRVEGTFGAFLGKPGVKFNGYEIHRGEVINGEHSYVCKTIHGDEGSVSPDGNVLGTNIHGLLESCDFTAALVGAELIHDDYHELLEENVNLLARVVKENLDVREIINYLGTSKT